MHTETIHQMIYVQSTVTSSVNVYGTINHSKFYPHDTTTMQKKKKENTHNISFTDLEQILDGSVWIVKAGSQCSNHLVSLEPHGHDLHHHVLVLLAGDQHALGRHLARGLRARALCGSCGRTGGGGRGSLRFCLTMDGKLEHLYTCINQNPRHLSQGMNSNTV